MKRSTGSKGSDGRKVSSNRLAIGSLVAAGAAIALGVGAAARADAATRPTTGPAELWAFCGVHPADPSAQRAADSLARDAGVTATFGPCNVPTGPYTADETADRYVDPDTYLRLVHINARAGMKTLVYDRRIWSDAAATRDAAIAFWKPVIADIAAWDMGDEFQPAHPQWQVLVRRWATVREYVTPRTGVGPFTNHVVDAVDDALADLPGSDELISFDHYNDGDMDVPAFVRSLDGRVHTVMCGVNALTHLIFTPTPESVQTEIAELTEAGCDRFLVFGGERVYETTDTHLFGDSSLVDADGRATPLAGAFLKASGRSAVAVATPPPSIPTADVAVAAALPASSTASPATGAVEATTSAAPTSVAPATATDETQLSTHDRWHLPSGQRMVACAALPGFGLPVEIVARRARRRRTGCACVRSAHVGCVAP